MFSFFPVRSKDVCIVHGVTRRVGHVWETAMTVLEFYSELGWWIKGPAAHSVTSSRVQKIRKRAWRQEEIRFFFFFSENKHKKQNCATNRKWAKKCQQLPHVPWCLLRRRLWTRKKLLECKNRGPRVSVEVELKAPDTARKGSLFLPPCDPILLQTSDLL